MHRKLLAVLMLALALLISVSSVALGQGDTGDAALRQYGGNGDDLPHPLGKQQRGLRQIALQQQLQGAQATGSVMRLGPDQFVELEREDEDLIWTVAADFGTRAHADYGGANGPQHNQIPEPDRSVDNTTIWVPDFSQEYYENLLFSEAPGAISMRNYYIELSSNRYTVDGDVTDWGKVPYNTARYGNNACGGSVCATVWYFVNDSVDDWYSTARKSMSKAQINAYLSKFDVWDRYDFDGDGNFDEPDGYIDHFQSLHAGQGEETGGGEFGTDAIWSHRWYAFYNNIGSDGPAFNQFGGVRVGDSNYWIGDYTIEPENGGVGVFAHEFAHDLGLPDLYDTAGGENSTGFWTLMSQGSYGNNGTNDIGSEPTHMGAWEKFQLGWLDYDVAVSGRRSTHRLGPAETTTNRAQGLFVLLPDKEVNVDLGAPYAGDYFYYSGSGNNLDNVMYREFDLPAGAWLSAQVRYQIELDWDYAYVVASDDGGATWTALETNLSTDSNPNGQNSGHGITGSSGGNWVELTADLSGYTGPTLLGFRYWTDVAAVEPGLMIDEIAVTGSPVDGAESDAGWTYDPADGGFRVTSGQESASYFNAYVAEFRQYWGFDESLRDGSYNFGFLDNPDLQNWVERFPYQDGLLISYWDGSQEDNNTSAHPGEGLILPIDAHPQTMYRADGVPWRPRVQSYDSPFFNQRTDAITLHRNSMPSFHRSQRGVRIFNDNNQYWNPETPTAGVMNPHTNTRIRILGTNRSGQFMSVEIR
ncbi:MAG: immune inhibitor A [Candidatus Promineofilum sp.]|nr:immune inhibitor A [Promineifilum sp.]